MLCSVALVISHMVEEKLTPTDNLVPTDSLYLRSLSVELLALPSALWAIDSEPLRARGIIVNYSLFAPIYDHNHPQTALIHLTIRPCS